MGERKALNCTDQREERKTSKPEVLLCFGEHAISDVNDSWIELIAMTRSIGDFYMHTFGVTSDAEFAEPVL